MKCGRLWRVERPRHAGYAGNSIGCALRARWRECRIELARCARSALPAGGGARRL